MESEPITVVIVEDNEGIRSMLTKVIKKAPSLRFLKSYPNAEEALAGLPELKPDVIVMDIQLPGASGIECTRAVREILPGTQIVVFTVFGDSDQVLDALKAGASGYLLKRSSPEEIVEAIEQVHHGGAPMSAGIARKVVDSFREPPKSRNMETESLSPREAEVLGWLAKGYVAKEIAEQIDISFFTVRFHIRQIYKKLHVRSRTEALLKYLK